MTDFQKFIKEQNDRLSGKKKNFDPQKRIEQFCGYVADLYRRIDTEWLKEELAKLRSVQYQVNRVINEREPEWQIQRQKTIEGR